MTRSALTTKARLRAVRLTDVPLAKRVRAAERLKKEVIADKKGPLAVLECIQLDKAAREPSDRVYWVVEEVPL